jgi:hypothetical protein
MQARGVTREPGGRLRAHPLRPCRGEAAVKTETGKTHTRTEASWCVGGRACLGGVSWWRAGRACLGGGGFACQFLEISSLRLHVYKYLYFRWSDRGRANLGTSHLKISFSFIPLFPAPGSR